MQADDICSLNGVSISLFKSDSGSGLLTPLENGQLVLYGISKGNILLWTKDIYNEIIPNIFTNISHHVTWMKNIMNSAG